MAKKYTEANDDKLPSGESIPIVEAGEFGEQPIEVMSEQDIVKTADLEKFMNDVLTIRIHPDNRQGSLPVPCPNVNGMNQPIIRGIPSKVKRKYVEALARCRETKYEQLTPDPSKPENIQLEDVTMLSYPFVVLHDPHPRGREWLEAILAQK